MDAYPFLRPLLFTLPAERAHRLAIAALRTGLVAEGKPPLPSLQVRAFGYDFASPVGLAAGFDKNAEVVDPLLKAGFGFVEAGTVTPRPQSGNPPPRLFRLPEDEAIINRLGFNNKGGDAFVARLKRRRQPGIVGANIGKNKDSADAIADYVSLLRTTMPHADYVTVNISSPNTQGLRDLQHKDALNGLLQALMEARNDLPPAARKPLLLKIAPDLEAAQMEAIAEAALTHRLDGLIISNTTLARPAELRSALRTEKGGLSGRPLMAPSTEILSAMYRLTHAAIPLIGVGGIFSGEDAYAKIRAGATLVQLYSGLVYRGLGLVEEIHATLPRMLARDGYATLAEAVGTGN